MVSKIGASLLFRLFLSLVLAPRWSRKERTGALALVLALALGFGHSRLLYSILAYIQSQCHPSISTGPGSLEHPETGSAGGSHFPPLCRAPEGLLSPSVAATVGERVPCDCGSIVKGGGSCQSIGRLRAAVLAVIASQQREPGIGAVRARGVA
jgi:hypothetical protein